MESDRAHNLETAHKDRESDGDRAVRQRHDDLTMELLVCRVRRTRILMRYCEDERGLDGIEEEIRQNIRERAQAGDELCWEINRSLTVLENEIERLKAEIFEIRLKVGEKIKRETEGKDFS